MASIRWYLLTAKNEKVKILINWFSSLCQTGSISADFRARVACVEGREREGGGRDKRQPLLKPVRPEWLGWNGRLGFDFWPN